MEGPLLHQVPQGSPGSSQRHVLYLQHKVCIYVIYIIYLHTFLYLHLTLYLYLYPLTYTYTLYSISNTSPGIDTRELGPRVITGGKDGFVHIWDIQLRKMWSLNLAETLPKSVCPQIQAVATKENRLLIGTKASEIYEVSLLSHAEVYKLVEGHFDTRGEVWGIATHPKMQRFVTCGDDMTGDFILYILYILYISQYTTVFLS
jgi:WD40 repeat protein